jgi:hypothetical protein
MFATAVSVVESSGHITLWHRAVIRGRNEARQPEYLSPRMARSLKVATSSDPDIGKAVRAFAADCRAVGVDGPVFLTSTVSGG